MISYLKGTIYDITEEAITLVVQESIGYEIYISTNDREKLKKNQLIEIFCYHYITDRTQELYGFLNKKHKILFTLLAEKVAGIGPKSALKIFNKGSYETIKKAIEGGNIEEMQALGIGKKTAGKIIVALKDMLYGKETPISFIINPLIVDTRDALLNLGYTKQEIDITLKNIDTAQKSVEQILREALQLLRTKKVK